MSIECAMEIWKAGGGVAASEWQEKSGYSRGGPIYKRRATPVFCRELTREGLELEAINPHEDIASYYRSILAYVTGRYPKARKVIVVNDPDGLRTACMDAGIPAPRFLTLVDGWIKKRMLMPQWDIGSTEECQHVAKAKPRYAWQGLVKRLDPAPALGS
jgi:hypothetical protein